MRNVKLIRLAKVVAAVGAVSIAMGVFGHGCGNLKSNGGDGSSSFGSSSCKSTGFEEVAIAPGESTVSLLYGDTILRHYATCTGMGNIANLAAKTTDEYEQRSNAFSEYGSALDVTAPMLMGSLAVAGEVCDDVFDREFNLPDVQASSPGAADGRSIFVGWGDDLSGSTCPSDQVIDETIARMAFSCWSVKAEDLDVGNQEVSYVEALNIVFGDELGVMKNGLSEVGGDRRSCAITLCSAMLSSLRGLMASQ